MSQHTYSISPIGVGTIHFIGIGGIGMSGIAEILKISGYDVQGSDIGSSYVTERLEALGIRIFIGHSGENIKNVSIVVKSTAIHDSNPEIMYAKELGIPIIRRSEMLAEIMRFKHCIAVSGSHGKTTTTSLVAKMLEDGGLNPTVINGGIINEFGSNARLGSGQFLVAEADESDGTFLHIPAFAAVITNISPEHLDYYGDFENVKGAYRAFIENLPFYGFGILCFDHKTVRGIAEQITNRAIISYGVSALDADITAHNIVETASGFIFEVRISDRLCTQLKLGFNSIENVEVGILGEHNLQNSLSAIAIALKLGIPVETIKTAFKNFRGVKRRFTKVGEADGILIIDDYAHHPVEIKATLKVARKVADSRKGRLIAIAQPHRYSRVQDLMDEFSTSFSDVDLLYVADIYAAGEVPIEGVNSKVLVDKIREHGKKNVEFLGGEYEIIPTIASLLKRGDMVIFLGAGDVTKWAYRFLEGIALERKVKVA